jgi:methyl-accepting chemotaxis protein
VTSLFAQSFGNLLASHWNVVLLVGFAFFLLQIGLCLRFVLRMRRQARTLTALYQDVLDGGDGRPTARVGGGRFPWLTWVDEVFPAGTKTPGNYTRDDVLKELDTRLASCSDYLLLQRMGVMAPLLGVILTVLGFWWLEVDPSSDMSLNDILLAVTPLVVGVGTGAVLALINQGLLHAAGMEVESLRMAARSWFDTVIWSDVGLDTQAATVKAVSGVEKMAQAVSEAAEKQNDSAQWLSDSTLAIQKAAAQFSDTIRDFHGRTEGLPEELGGMRDALESAVETLQSLTPVSERVIAGLDVSVSAFKTAVENQFVEAARLHRTAVGDIFDSAERLERTTEHLVAGAQKWSQVVSAHSGSFQELGQAVTHSLQVDLVPAHQKLRATVDSFNTCVGEISACMRSLRSTTESLSGNIEAATQNIGTFAHQFEPTVTAFRDAVDSQFTTATEQHAHQVKALTESVDQIHQSGEALAKGTTALEQLLTKQAALQEQVEPTQHALLAATEKIARAGDTLGETLQSEVTLSQQVMGDAAKSFATSADHLQAIITEGLAPVTERLVVLDQTLARLEGTVSALHEFSAASSNVEELSQSLAQAASVSRAISELPERIQEILERLVAAQQEAKTNSSGKMLGWLRGRSDH